MKERHFRCDKLIRDKAVANGRERGFRVEFRVLTTHERLDYLKKKILEEAGEVSRAKSLPELLEELADLQEVINGLKTALDIPDEMLERHRLRKKEALGGFEKGLCASAFVLPEGHPALEHFRNDPHQYLEERSEGVA